MTDEDAGDVFNVFANYTPVQQDQFMESLLDRKRLATLIANTTGSAGGAVPAAVDRAPATGRPRPST